MNQALEQTKAALDSPVYVERSLRGLRDPIRTEAQAIAQAAQGRWLWLKAVAQASRAI